MASRYERVCLIEKLQNNPEINVELLAGAVLRDNLENALKCQLKFRVIGKSAAHRVSVSVDCFDANSNKIYQTIHTYDDGPYEPETDYGTDVLIGIDSNTAYVEVNVHLASFDADIQLAIRNHTPFRVFEFGTVYVGRLMEYGKFFIDEDAERGETCIKELPKGKNVLILQHHLDPGTKVTIDISANSTMTVAFNYKTKRYEVTSETPSTLKILDVEIE